MFTPKHYVNNWNSKHYQGKDVSYDELKLLGQAGDQTCWDFKKQQAIEGLKLYQFVKWNGQVYWNIYQLGTNIIYYR